MFSIFSKIFVRKCEIYAERLPWVESTTRTGCKPIKTSAIFGIEMAVAGELFTQQFIMKITANDARAPWTSKE